MKGHAAIVILSRFVPGSSWSYVLFDQPKADPLNLPYTCLPFLKTGGGGGFCVFENMNLQFLARQNLCHFLKMSEQKMCGSRKLLMRNSGCLKREGTAEGGRPLPKTQNTLLNIMIRRRAVMCGQHKEHADTRMYFSTSATSRGK